MTEGIDYLKIAKKNLDHANKPGSENIDSAALIAIAAALIAKIEDDRRCGKLDARRTREMAAKSVGIQMR